MSEGCPGYRNSSHARIAELIHIKGRVTACVPGGPDGGVVPSADGQLEAPVALLTDALRRSALPVAH